MKISCIIASFNRPKFLREALQSIITQTYQNYQVVIVDDSTKMNIFEIVPEFNFTESVVIHEQVSATARAKTNRLGMNINTALEHVTGDIVCYLGDDDAFFPTWFERMSRYFEENPAVQVGFGILKYCQDKLDFAEHGEVRFWNEIIKDPSLQMLDHNQVCHRRFDPLVKWQENLGSEGNADFWFFSQLATKHEFHPINSFAAVKRLHSKNLQNHIPLYQSGKMDDLRE